MVRLVAETMRTGGAVEDPSVLRPFVSVFVWAPLSGEPRSSLVRPKTSMTSSAIFVLKGGGSLKTVNDGCKSPVEASKLEECQRSLRLRDLLWETVTWTFNKTKELWARQHKVEYLGEEEQDHRLWKVALNRNGRECHAGEVAQSVARESFGRVPDNEHVMQSGSSNNSPVVGQKACADANEREHEVQAHEMSLDDLTRGPRQNASLLGISNMKGFKEPVWPNGEKEKVIESHRECDDKCLDGLDTVDASENVDRVGGECGE